MATTPDYQSEALNLVGDASVSDNDVVIQSGDLGPFKMFSFMCTAGTADIYPSLDGTNYATAALSLIDAGATTLDPVTEAAPNRLYQFYGSFKTLRVLQKGATAVEGAVLRCR